MNNVPYSEMASSAIRASGPAPSVGMEHCARHRWGSKVCFTVGDSSEQDPGGSGTLEGVCVLLDPPNVFLVPLPHPVFLSFFGIASIGLSCLVALFLYHVVFGVQYLGILNGVAAFVIVGIGELPLLPQQWTFLFICHGCKAWLPWRHQKVPLRPQSVVGVEYVWWVDPWHMVGGTPKGWKEQEGVLGRG